MKKILKSYGSNGGSKGRKFEEFKRKPINYLRLAKEGKLSGNTGQAKRKTKSSSSEQ